jgi:hypothetical protein
MKHSYIRSFHASHQLNLQPMDNEREYLPWMSDPPSSHLSSNISMWEGQVLTSADIRSLVYFHSMQHVYLIKQRSCKSAQGLFDVKLDRHIFIALLCRIKRVMKQSNEARLARAKA